ncbi:MAG: hypothetical protein RLZZ126_1171 [Pseudomonadota bacterium]|jgi:hypothetical protein
MLIAAIAWIYVALMMALAEAFNPQGTVLGALITFVLYGLFPVGILLYIGLTPARKRARRDRDAREATARHDAESAVEPDAGSEASGAAHAAGADTAITPVRKKH